MVREEIIDTIKTRIKGIPGTFITACDILKKSTGEVLVFAGTQINYLDNMTVVRLANAFDDWTLRNNRLHATRKAVERLFDI